MIPYAERYRLCQKVWLNDEPASVTGAAQEFAIVIDVRSGLSCEWSWETVKRVVDHRGGRFYT